MTELIDLVVSWQALGSFGTALLVFGFAPGFVLRLIVKLYPKDDPRRAELVAELYGMPRVWRPMWVTQQIETGLFEGLGARRAARRAARRKRQAALPAFGFYVSTEEAEVVRQDRIPGVHVDADDNGQPFVTLGDGYQNERTLTRVFLRLDAESGKPRRFRVRRRNR